MKNPIKHIINDEIFSKLENMGFLHEKNLRDYSIVDRFKKLRYEGLSAGEAIDTIQEQHKYLEFDSIRKIVYSKKWNK